MPDTDEQKSPEAVPDEDDFDWLSHRIAHQTDDPDRYTVFPSDVDEDRKLSTWMTVDAACVIELESAR